MLIKCPECGKEVSSEASSCPFCGYPIKQSLAEEKLVPFEKYSEEEIRQFVKEAKEYSKNASASAAIGIFFLFGGILAIVLALAVLDDADNGIVIGILGEIFAPIGLLILIVGCAVNGTKCNNRMEIVNKYKERHPDFKEEE